MNATQDMFSETLPQGIITLLWGQYVKIGAKGKAFAWRCGEWQLTQISPLEVKRKIQKDRSKF